MTRIYYENPVTGALAEITHHAGEPKPYGWKIHYNQDPYQTQMSGRLSFFDDAKRLLRGRGYIKRITRRRPK